MIPFDETFAHQTPQEFIDRRPRRSPPGAPTFGGRELPLRPPGRGRPGRCCAGSEFETRVVPLVEVDGEVVSSSHIRALIQAGEVEAAARMLGAPVPGAREVVRGGSARTRAGFPDGQPRSRRRAGLPRPWCLRGPGGRRVFGRQRRRAAHVRHRAEACSIEAYILDRGSSSSTATRLRLDFLTRLRGERRFESVEALVEQMHRDVERVEGADSRLRC